jgi:hypothetical protein
MRGGHRSAGNESPTDDAVGQVKGKKEVVHREDLADAT